MNSLALALHSVPFSIRSQPLHNKFLFFWQMLNNFNVSKTINLPPSTLTTYLSEACSQDPQPLAGEEVKDQPLNRVSSVPRLSGGGGGG